MELVIDERLLEQLAAHGVFNEKICRKLAEDVLAQKDPLAMAQFLLTREAAENLLTERLMAQPVETLQAVEGMPLRPPGKRSLARQSKRRGRFSSKAAGKRTGRKPKDTSAAAKKTGGKRQRLTAKQVETLKNKVLAFLKEHPNSPRAAITSAAGFKSQAIYLRVMAELKDSKAVISQGTRRSVTYSLR